VGSTRLAELRSKGEPLEKGFSPTHVPKTALAAALLRKTILQNHYQVLSSSMGVRNQMNI